MQSLEDLLDELEDAAYYKQTFLINAKRRAIMDKIQELLQQEKEKTMNDLIKRAFNTFEKGVKKHGEGVKEAEVTCDIINREEYEFFYGVRLKG